MWNPGKQKVRNVTDFNYELSQIKGDFSDEQAKILLAKFLRINLGFTLDFFAGFDLLPVQEIVLKGILLNDISLIVAGRGWSKSTLLSILALIYPIFYPNSKMCLVSSNFRNARRILEASEKIINSKKGELMRQCFPNSMRRGNDIFEWKLTNGSAVFALPLSSNGGEGLRGTRASYCAVDEGLLISKEIQESVIRPFLTVKMDPMEEMRIRTEENDLIKRGLLLDSERISFPKNKYSIFSSASYEFEFLFETYKRNIELILNPEKNEEKNDPARIFVVRASYESLPENSLMDLTQINAAKAAMGEHSEIFKREYKGLFSSSSDSYFNVRRMMESSVSAGNFPTTQIKGELNGDYILSIDPSYSSSKNSDHFAMGVFLVNYSERKVTLVHSYARAGGQLFEHFQYLYYLLTYFNIVFICIDGSGTEFITGFNESSLAKERNINLDFLTEKLDSEDFDEYSRELIKAKSSYNLTKRKIVWPQNFVGKLRVMNETMQNYLDSGKLWFASFISQNPSALKKAMEINLPFKFKDNHDKEYSLIDFVEEQDIMIRETIKEISLIEVRSNSSGSLSYDLPPDLRNLSGDSKIRRDNYTTALLGIWAFKIFSDLTFCAGEEPPQDCALPIIIR